MNADAKFLASRPERLPKGIAEIFQSVHRHTGIAQHVDAEMTRFDCALYLGDDCVDRAHKGNYCERDESLCSSDETPPKRRCRRARRQARTRRRRKKKFRPARWEIKPRHRCDLDPKP